MTLCETPLVPARWAVMSNKTVRTARELAKDFALSYDPSDQLRTSESGRQTQAHPHSDAAATDDPTGPNRLALTSRYLIPRRQHVPQRGAVEARLGAQGARQLPAVCLTTRGCAVVPPVLIGSCVPHA